MLLVASIGMFEGAHPASAQLISPGKLTTAHAELEGIRQCTNCHRLRERGVVGDLCLQCHEALRTRIAEQRGYHAALGGQECADCHKEHFGRDFDLLRFDSTTFDHDEAGFELVERHAELACRDCHRGDLIVAADVRAFKGEHGALDRTFLGLGTTCRDCHSEVDPHGSQFADRACTDCHSQTAWAPASGFDHGRTRYSLTGSHRDLDCTGCHEVLRAGEPPMLRYAGVAFGRCIDCHRDHHEGRMGGDCQECHNTGSWREIARGSFERTFQHDARRFTLRGVHVELDCDACHTLEGLGLEGVQLSFAESERSKAYPRPAADDCLSCHRDYHDGVFVSRTDGASCRNCHTEESWLPTTYDLARHNGGETFALTGAHIATPCSLCHRGVEVDPDALSFRMPFESCRDCHEPDNPHGTQFVNRECDECHDTGTFRIPSFDHDRTNFPLDGRHRDVDCDACHLTRDPMGQEVQLYRPLRTRCEDCHGGGQ